MDYICSRCGKRVSTTTRQAKCQCGGLWNLDYVPPKFSLDDVDRNEWSMFRYRKFMALEGDAWKDISLGEGMTPVVRFDENVLLKMDYFMPTLSFKDRGAAVLIAHCKAIGVDSVVQDSSGNAGNSVAAYSGKAGINCEIFVPEGTSPKKIDMIRAHGATCTVVPGSRDHCADVCRSKVDTDNCYYANHVYNPYFYEGTKTYIYEVFEQLGRMPKHILIPVGNGTLFLGAIYALEHLLASGVIEAMPKITASTPPPQSMRWSIYLRAGLLMKCLRLLLCKANTATRFCKLRKKARTNLPRLLLNRQSLKALPLACPCVGKKCLDLPISTILNLYTLRKIKLWKHVLPWLKKEFTASILLRQITQPTSVTASCMA